MAQGKESPASLHVSTPHCVKCLMVSCVSTDSLLWYSVLVHVLSTQMVIVCWILWKQLRDSSVVRAADCRSPGPWFNSRWRSWFTFMTCSDNLTNQITQMINIMSPITTSIRTITRKSVNMVAELDNDTAPSRIPDTTDCLEDLKAKDESQIAETRQTEATASHNFQMPQQSLKDEMKFNAQDLEAAKHSFGEVQGRLTTATTDLEMTEKILDEGFSST